MALTVQQQSQYIQVEVQFNRRFNRSSNMHAVNLHIRVPSLFGNYVGEQVHAIWKRCVCILQAVAQMHALYIRLCVITHPDKELLICRDASNVKIRFYAGVPIT